MLFVLNFVSVHHDMVTGRHPSFCRKFKTWKFSAISILNFYFAWGKVEGMKVFHIFIFLEQETANCSLEWRFCNTRTFEFTFKNHDIVTVALLERLPIIRRFRKLQMICFHSAVTMKMWCWRQMKNECFYFPYLVIYGRLSCRRSSAFAWCGLHYLMISYNSNKLPVNPKPHMDVRHYNRALTDKVRVIFLLLN